MLEWRPLEEKGAILATDLGLIGPSGCGAGHVVTVVLRTRIRRVFSRQKKVVMSGRFLTRRERHSLYPSVLKRRPERPLKEKSRPIKKQKNDIQIKQIQLESILTQPTISVETPKDESESLPVPTATKDEILMAEEPQSTPYLLLKAVIEDEFDVSSIIGWFDATRLSGALTVFSKAQAALRLEMKLFSKLLYKHQIHAKTKYWQRIKQVNINSYFVLMVLDKLPHKPFPASSNHPAHQWNEKKVFLTSG